MPFSFREYLVAHPPDAMNPVDSRFQQYASKGAIPMVDPDIGDLADELLTLDRILPPSADGIKIMNLVDWLIGPES